MLNLVTMTFTKPTNTEWMEAVDWASKAPDSLNELKQHQIKSFPELIDTYPGCEKAAKRSAQSMIKELEKNISSLYDLRETLSDHVNSVDFTRQRVLIEYYDDLIKRLQEGYEKEIKKYQYQLNYLANLGKPEAEKPKDPITPLRVEQARQYPISELLEIKRGTTLCLWHDDHRPSMKIYRDNHVYCFVCNRRADSIDIYMSLNGVGFREAVRKLAP